jgi:hypothetical protein
LLSEVVIERREIVMDMYNEMRSLKEQYDIVSDKLDEANMQIALYSDELTKCVSLIEKFKGDGVSVNEIDALLSEIKNSSILEKAG